MVRFAGFNLDEILSIHSIILKASGEDRFDGVLNMGNLDLAIGAPLLKVYGRNIYPGVVDKIGALMYEITTLHPFIEGNKRTGFTCADMLMVKNGRIIVASVNERVKVSLEVARLEMNRDELIKWLKNNSKKMISTKMYDLK